MDGDSPDLSKIVSLKKKYNALLLVDEAHSFGICGEKGKGILHQNNLSEQADFIMATFGKSAGAAGAVTATSKIWRDLIINKARSFIYSTAPMPSQAAAASENMDKRTGDQFDLELKPSSRQDGAYFLIIRMHKLAKAIPKHLYYCHNDSYYFLTLSPVHNGVSQVMVGESNSIIDAFNDPAAEFFIK